MANEEENKLQSNTKKQEIYPLLDAISEDDEVIINEPEHQFDPDDYE